MTFIACLIFTTFTSSAQTTWTGAVNTSWNTAGNWTAGVPQAGVDVIIADVTNDPVLDIAGAAARSVSVDSGAFITLAVNSTLTISGATGAGFVNRGTVVNNGTIFISNMAAGSTYGLHNYRTFTNAAGASLFIEGIVSTGTAIRNSSPGVFTNAGIITSGTDWSAGDTGIDNYQTFNNNAGGQINIDRVATTAIRNIQTFNNTGTIKIGAVAGGGGWVGITNHESFFNNSNGLVQIDKVGSIGINTSGTPWGLENVGTMNIGTLPGGHTFNTGINTTGTFRIIGGSVNIDRVTDGIYMMGGSSTENYAKVTIGETQGVNRLLHGVGALKNKPGAVLKGSGIITANSLINEGGTVSPGYSPGKMTFDGPFSFFNNNTIIEIEVNGSGTAGIDYDQLDMVNGLGSFGTKLALTINYTPTVGDRIPIVRGHKLEGDLRPISPLPSGWQLEYGEKMIELVYDGIPTNSTWTGAVSNDWNIAGNWSDGIPGSRTSVNIPKTTNAPVISTATATAQYVYVAYGNTLTVASTGILSINGASSVGLYNQGTVQNNGTINIGNLSSVGNTGVRNQGVSFINSAGAVLNIDRVAVTGLDNYNGTFNNAGTISVGKLSAAGSNALRSESTFNNQPGGIINLDRSTSTALYNVSGTFTNEGTIVIGANAAAGSDGLDNDGSFNNAQSGKIKIDRVSSAGIYNNGASFINAGEIAVGALNGGNTISWGIYIDKTFNNTGGSISIDRVNAALAVSTNTFNNNGELLIGSLSPVAVLLSGTGAGTFSNNAGGIIKGTGTIDANRFVNAGGTIAPGYSPGTITFSGNEDFSNNTMQIELGGTDLPGTDYDQLVVNGTMTAGGNLIINAINDFKLVPGQSFNIINANSVNGTFSSITWPEGITGSVTYLSTGIEINVAGVLPLRLIDFTVHTSGNRTKLLWQTAEEENTALFEVQRSSNGTSFQTIATIAAAGNGANHYFAFDENPLHGNNFYRLKMLDIDGKFTFSKIRSLTVAPAGGLQIAPVPAKTEVKITVNDKSLTGRQVFIYNSVGNIMVALVLNNNNRIDISNWPRGIYFVKTPFETYRIVKQ